MSYASDLEIARDVFAKYRLENFPKLSEDDAFERFASHLVMKRFGLDEPGLELGIVGGKDDGGLDSMYLLLNKSEQVEDDSVRLGRSARALSGLQTNVPLDIVIVQAKNETSWDTNVFPKLESSLRDIFNSKVSEAKLRAFPLSDSVIERARRLRKLRSKLTTLIPRISVRVVYISFANDAKIEPYMRTKQRQFRKSLGDALPSNSVVNVEYVGAAGIGDFLRESADFMSTLKFMKTPVREGSALLGLTSIGDFLQFVRHPKSKIVREDMFSTNVRDFAGRNVTVNRAIAATLASDSASSFWWVNNGITVVTDRAEDPEEDIWVLTNPVIVNGLQTSHVIHSQELDGQITKKRLKQAVLVRVITVSDPTVREAVITGTNNQSPVTGLQLHANDEKQLRVESYLSAHGWFYERRRYQYRGRRVPAAKLRGIRELGQAVMAVRLLMPDVARAPHGVSGVGCRVEICVRSVSR